jgi:hypothetical protein
MKSKITNWQLNMATTAEKLSHWPNRPEEFNVAKSEIWLRLSSNPDFIIWAVNKAKEVMDYNNEDGTWTGRWSGQSQEVVIAETSEGNQAPKKPRMTRGEFLKRRREGRERWLAKRRAEAVERMRGAIRALGPLTERNLLTFAGWLKVGPTTVANHYKWMQEADGAKADPAMPMPTPYTRPAGITEEDVAECYDMFGRPDEEAISLWMDRLQCSRNAVFEAWKKFAKNTKPQFGPKSEDPPEDEDPEEEEEPDESDEEEVDEYEEEEE